MNKNYAILVINPGSTSTKIALYQGTEPVLSENLHHGSEELSAFAHIADQHEMRRDRVLQCLERHQVDLHSLDAVVGRGGILRPIPSGTYRVNERMLAE